MHNGHGKIFARASSISAESSFSLDSIFAATAVVLLFLFVDVVQKFLYLDQICSKIFSFFDLIGK